VRPTDLARYPCRFSPFGARLNPFYSDSCDRCSLLTHRVATEKIRANRRRFLEKLLVINYKLHNSIVMKLRIGISVGLFFVFLSLYPQLYFQSQRGPEFNGATFYYDYDEPFYGAYLQALIDGRPRKNSVYEGGPEPEEHETFLSVQFFPPTVAAVPAALLGLSSEETFLFISAIFAFFSALSVYWLIYRITENPIAAAGGTLFILIFGPGAAGISILKEFLGFGPSAFYLTFLRRYTPAMAFPFIFLLVGTVWLGLKTNDKRKRYFYAIVTSGCFAVLVYSYFFFWTGILAWLTCLACLHFLILRDKKSLPFWAVVVVGMIVTLIPYFALLANREPTADAAQVLEQTRRIVFLRPTLLLGVVVFVFTLIGCWVGRLKLRPQLTVFIISFAVLPLIVFNQQVVTGYSLQPMHYNMYLLNYLVLLGVLLLATEVFQPRMVKIKPLFALVPAIFFGFWGIIETQYTVANRFDYNARRDEAILVNRHLAKIGRENSAARSEITMNFDLVQADNQPTLAPHGVLWAEHLGFANLSPDEYRKRFFLYLYFQNRDEEWVRRRLQTCPNEACRALLGWRINPTLSHNLSRIDPVETESLVNEYSSFVRNITAVEAFNPMISYLVAPDGLPTDFNNLEKWYVKKEAGHFGKFTLYKVTPIAR
jgi:hypothetical protein